MQGICGSRSQCRWPLSGLIDGFPGGLKRPAMLRGDRQSPRRSEQFFQAIYPLLKPLLVGRLRRWRAIEAGQVARAMIALSRQPAGCEVVENERLLQL